MIFSVYFSVLVRIENIIFRQRLFLTLIKLHNIT